MGMQYRIAVEGGVRDVDDSKRQVLVSFPFETLDSYKTDFERSCFDEFLTRSLPIMCWQHDRKEPIGRARSWQKTDTANEFVAAFSDFDAVPRARQAFAQIRDGELTDFSYGFDRAQSVPHPQVRGAIRFTKARMPEISPVSVGSIPGAVAVGIRAEAEVANIRGLVDAGAITEEEAAAMMRAAGVEPAGRERVEVGHASVTVTPDTEGFAEAVRAAVAAELHSLGLGDGERDDDPTATLAQAVDAALDGYSALIDGVDRAGLPENVRHALALADAASVTVDSLLDELGVEDLDEASEDATNVGDGGRSAEDIHAEADDSGERAAVSDKPWSQFSEADYTTAQWKAACLIVLGDGSTKADCKLPVREPDGTLNRNGVHAAAAVLAGGRGGVRAPIAAKVAAARTLVGLYRQIGEQAPEALSKLADGKRDDTDLDLRAAEALARINERLAG